MAKTSSWYVTGGTTAALVMICFGALWSMQGEQIMYLITPIVTAGLLVLWFLTRQAIRRLPHEQEAPAEHVQRQQVYRRFGVVVATEVAAIVAAVVLLRLMQHPQDILPTICLIVGLHFLPLAALFQFRMYVLVSVALSLLGGGALLASIVGLTLGTPSSRSVVVGLGAAGVLWLASLVLLMRVRHVLRLHPVFGLA